MNYAEVSKHLLRLRDDGHSVYCVKSELGNSTALYLVPCAWFIAYEPAGYLFMGVYKGKNLRSCCTRRIKCDELTPRLLEAQIHIASNRRLR